jgi:hypothetical protein
MTLELVGRGICTWGPGPVLKLIHGPTARSRAAGLPAHAACEASSSI